MVRRDRIAKNSQRSRALELYRTLTDDIGSRLTGSPAHLQAARDLLGATAAQDAAKARIHLNALQRSCAECHKAHK